MPEAIGEAVGPLGLLGGTFDPVHNGHLRLAEEAADALDLRTVRWIPTGQPVLREAPQASAVQRLAMVRLATAGNERFEVDASEVEAARPSYTVSTLERLRRADVCGASRPLIVLLGADAFAGLMRWHRWESLFDLAHFAVAHRPGFAVDPAHLPAPLGDHYRQRFCQQPSELAQAPAGRIACFAMTALDISATKIRVLLSKGGSPRYLIPDALFPYIEEHHLYPEI